MGETYTSLGKNPSLRTHNPLWSILEMWWHDAVSEFMSQYVAVYTAVGIFLLNKSEYQIYSLNTLCELWGNIIRILVLKENITQN